MTDEPPLSQEQARQLRMTMHACIDQLGGPSMDIDKEENAIPCRTALIGGCLLLTDIPGDRRVSRFRQLDLIMVERGPRFRVDPTHRLALFHTMHFAEPPDWHLQLCRPPELWLRHAMTLMLAELRPVMDRVAPRSN